MRLRQVSLTLIVVLALFSWSLVAVAQDGGQGTADMDAMMAAMEKYSVPGPEHEQFKKLVGNWDLTTKFMMAPDAPAVESKGTASSELVMGGRYIKETVVADMMGNTMHGTSYTGFDRFKQKYLSIWFDDMSTAMLMSYGTCDGDVCTFFGEMDDPMTGEANKKIKQVARWVDDNTRTFAMYDQLPDGTEWMTMEVTYTRKK